MKEKQKRLLTLDRIEHYKELYPSFQSPIDILLLTMNRMNTDGSDREDVTLRDQIECAKAALPFQCPKLSQVEVQAEQEVVVTSDEEKVERLRQLMNSPAMKDILKGE